MKKLILLFCLLFIASFELKAQCFTAAIDTGNFKKRAVTWGQHIGVSDTGYFQPVTFNLICKGLNWAGFEATNTILVYIPNTLTTIQMELYVFSKINAYLTNNYPSH